MHFLNYYNKNIVQYDLINKFKYKNIKVLPKLKSIIVQFCFKKYELKNLLTSLAALQFITNKKGVIIKSKTANISLKVRKGYPVGCKVILRHTDLNYFLEKLINNFTISNKILNLTKIKTNSFLFKITSILNFVELENNYRFFNKLNSALNLCICTTTSDPKQLIFLLKSYKIKILKCKCNSIGRV